MAPCSDCTCLNVHSHPGETEGCAEGCMMACGYCTPVVVAGIILAIALASDAYCVLIIVRNSSSAWRIIVSLVLLFLISALAALVLWSYYAVICTAPGFVPAEPWANPPVLGRRGPSGLVEVIRRAPTSSSRGSAPQRLSQQPSSTATTTTNRSPCTAAETAPAAADEDALANPFSTGVDIDIEGDARETSSPPIPPVEQRDAIQPSQHSPYPPSPYRSKNPNVVTQTDRRGGVRYCYTCHLYKPDHAHHCSICRRCVYKFDHHCPFINNCVGRNNYKLFITFLLYGGVGATLAAGLLCIAIFAVDGEDLMTKLGWIGVAAFAGVLGVALLLFYAQHRMYLRGGDSTLDSIIRGNEEPLPRWCRRGPRVVLSAEDQEALRRAKQVRAEEHRQVLLGREHPWWRRYLPFPIRTDDGPDSMMVLDT